MVLVFTGCVDASFVRTDAGYVIHEREELPVVYVDRLPSQPYLPVGIIEVSAPDNFSLNEIINAASVKGKEIGCDVVVERSIHRVSWQDGDNRGRWFVMLGEDRGVCESAAPSARITHSGLVGYASPTYSPLYTPMNAPAQAITPVYVLPQNKRHEYICGITSQSQADTSPRAAEPPPSEPDLTVGMGKVLWKALATADEDETNCLDIYELLANDKECTGDACAAATLVADEYPSHCSEDVERRKQVRAWRTLWTIESAEHTNARCTRALKNAARSPEAAKHYPTVCGTSRTMGHTERAVVERTVKQAE